MSAKKREELCRQIEAQQSIIQKLIDDSKRLTDHSDSLMRACRNEISESEGETEDA